MNSLNIDFTLETLDPAEIIGKVLMSEGNSYRILEIEKSWSNSPVPVILSNVIIQNTEGEKKTFRLVAKKSFSSEIWNCTIKDIQN